MRRALPGLLVVLAFAVQPAAGQAAYTILGSDLSAPADVAEAQQADVAFWAADLADGRSTRVPAYGQITSIRMKGKIAAASGAPPPFTGGSGNFQALSPNGDGSVTVRQSSQPIDVPTTGDSQQINTFTPEHLCVRPGEWVGFTEYGGWNPPYYPNGVPFQIFSRSPGSNTRLHTRDGGTKTGSRFTGVVRADQELLMQMVLSTGKDVGHLCPRGPKRKFPGVTVRRQLADAFVRKSKGYARIRTVCPDDLGLCEGTMRVTSAERNRKKRRTLGRVRFAIGPGNTVAVRLPLTPRAQLLIRRRDLIKALVRTSVKDRYDQKESNLARVRLKARFR